MSTAGANEGLTLTVHRRIHDVSPSDWDAAAARQPLFCSHRFLQVVEESNSESAEFWYLLFHAGKRPVAAAVLSAFDVRLDVLISPAMQHACAIVRRVFPGFMRTRVLFCGLPVSVGRHTLTSIEPTLDTEVTTAVIGQMHRLARSRGIRHLCIKEFPEDGMPAIHRPDLCNLFAAASVPQVQLPIRWSSFASYLESMRHAYRRQIRLHLAKVTHDIRLVTGGTEVCSASAFHVLYRQVMRRASTKLEVLNERFFEALYERFRHELILIAVKRRDQVLGAALLIEQRGQMVFLFAGLDYARRDEYDVYFNLLNAMVELAINRGCSSLDLGQTSYEPKLRRGGQAQRMRFYFGATSRLRYLLLKSLRPILFPDYRPPHHHVFRTPEHTSGEVVHQA